jgi:hypothetical protein
MTFQSQISMYIIPSIHLPKFQYLHNNTLSAPIMKTLPTKISFSLHMSLDTCSSLKDETYFLTNTK